MRTQPNRRGFLASLAGGLAIAPLARGGDGRPPVTNPRALSGDAIEPDWSERLTIAVGPKGGDINGSDDKAIQAAVDYVTRLGGGTVRILPGTFRLRNAVYLTSKLRILGSGSESILIKEPSVTARLAANSDWYDQEITLEDASGFRIGDGICLRAKDPHDGGATVIKRTLVARSGNRFKLDKALRENLWAQGQPTASTLFPLISGEFVSDVTIENLVLDGNRDNNAELNGNYSGCVFLQDCNRITMRKVEARRNHGDGLSWQVCHDVTVEDCYSHGHHGLGLHPGSGSQRPLMRNNRVERNDIGIFFCWGVRFGLAEGNQLDGNQTSVSIGHRDTDNLVRKNTIKNSGKVGVLFRDEAKVFAGHRNRIEENTIVDSGNDKGVAIDVQGETEDVILARNVIRETRSPAQRVGIRIGKKTSNVQLVENTIQGFPTGIARIS